LGAAGIEKGLVYPLKSPGFFLPISWSMSTVKDPQH
jgi:hypothetical protein